MGNCQRIGIQIEHPPDLRDHAEHLTRRHIQQLQLQRVCFTWPGADPQPARRLRPRKNPLVTDLVNQLDTRQGTVLQESQQRREVIRRAITQTQNQCLACTRLGTAPERPGLGMIGFGKRRIETSQAAKPRCHRHVGDRQVRLGQ